MLYAPVKGFNPNLHISQYYHPGHKALDIVRGYGTPICAPERVKVEKVLTSPFLADLDPTDGVLEGSLKNGFGCWMTGLETGQVYLYWHMLIILPVWGGDVVEGGSIIGYMGNTGTVSQLGQLVPIHERLIPPYKGTHLHTNGYGKGKKIGEYLGGEINLAPLYTKQPAYTTDDFIRSYLKVLIKMAKLSTRS